MSRVAIVGCGYVGLVTAACLAMHHDVFAYDNNESLIADLKDGKCHIDEPRLPERLERGVYFSSKPEVLSNQDFIILAVGTPSDENGQTDLTAFFAAAATIRDHAKPGTIVIVKSTVPVGTTEVLANDKKLHYVFSPEFLSEGTAVRDYLNPARIVVGKTKDCPPPSTILAKDLLCSHKDDSNTYLITDSRSAELIKYASNTMLAMRISFMNEMAAFADVVGANMEHVRLGVGYDPRIGRQFLKSGPGYGGSCFPKDVASLACQIHDAGVEPVMVSAVEKANSKAIDNANNIALALANEASIVAVWGLAFKHGTSDLRKSPSLGIIETLLSTYGNLIVKVYDPLFSPHTPGGRRQLQSLPEAHVLSSPHIVFCDSKEAATWGAQLLIIAHDNPQYNDVELDTHTCRVFDPWGVVESSNCFVRKLGEPSFL